MSIYSNNRTKLSGSSCLSEVTIEQLKKKAKDLVDKAKSEKDELGDFIEKKKEEMKKKLSSLKKNPTALEEAASENTYYALETSKMEKKLETLSNPKEFYAYLKVKDEIEKYLKDLSSLTEKDAYRLMKTMDDEYKKGRAICDKLNTAAANPYRDDEYFSTHKYKSDNDNIVTLPFAGSKKQYAKKIEESNEEMQKMLKKIEELNKKYRDAKDEFCTFSSKLYDSIKPIDRNDKDINVQDWWDIEDFLTNDIYPKCQSLLYSYYDTIYDAIEDNIDILYEIGYYKAK